ncbi:MAG: hypothetical protein PHQ40_20420 [Anaerolineaceae bacterium]|nr:hypothetical protein [Anaerolineaceae bacterium]
MSDNSLENIYAYAERAYIRLQAGDVLMRCMEDASVAPMYQMVESLVLAGPESLQVLREILAETNTRKVQVDDDLQQVLTGLKTNLEGFGVRLRSIRKATSLSRLKPVRFLGLLRSQGVSDEETQTICLRLLQDARDLVSSLQQHYALLADIENYLEDWIWGVFYQSVRQGTNASVSPFLEFMM